VDTLVLTRSEVADLLEPKSLLGALRDAFIAYSTGRTVEAMRIPLVLPDSGAAAGASGMLLAPGLVPGIPAYSVKVHSKFPGQRPAIRGVLVLHDLASGAPLALIESSHLTALRTGLAGALGAEALSLPTARTVAIIGAGAQGRSHLAALQLVRSIDVVRVFDPDSEAAQRFALDPCCSGLRVALTASLEEALDEADLIATATWARKHSSLSGTYVPACTDEPGKCEVAADALKVAVVIVDDRRLAVEMGAVGGARLGPEVIHAELGEVLAGKHSGRTDAAQITVFASVGLAFQDLAAGWLAYTLARRHGIGRSIDLLG
jgi:ornithine cyclodeaminase